jgi:putative DNA primase/helicase
MPERIGDEAIYLRLEKLKKGLLQFTDTSNGFRLMREHGRDIRYVQAWKKWVVWTGRQWKIDDGYLVHDKGLQMIRGIYDELLAADDYRDRLEIEKYAMQAEAVRRRKAFIEAASWIPDLNIATSDVDGNHFLLNVMNGTVELKTGTFREHRQEDMITKLANVEYREGAECPV